MRTLFFRELHQGRALLAFSLLLGLLVPLGYQILSRTSSLRLYALPGQHDLAVIFGQLMLLLPLVVAVFAGAGLFAAEADRGTLPALFALPLSRRRIWTAKVLAGFVIAVGGATLILSLGAALLPQAARAVLVSAYLPDMALTLVFAFAVAVFASVVTSTALAAVVSTLLLSGLLALGAGFVWSALGGLLLGYHPLLDLALWGLATAPALFCASALVVSRGELLQSRRRHLLAFPALFLGLLAMLLLVCGLARWLTRYDRQTVESIQSTSMPSGSRVVVFTTQAQAVPLQRAGMSEGWEHRPTAWESDQIGTSELGPLYRSAHSIFLDLHSGRELLVLRGSAHGLHDLVSSPDGRYAAALAGPGAITWGREDEWRASPPKLHLYDLTNGRQLRTLAPKNPDQLPAVLDNLQWSPDGRWLGISAIGAIESGKHTRSLWVVRADGSLWRDLHVQPSEFVGLRGWAWSPTEEVIHAYDEQDRLLRVPIDRSSPEVVWSPPKGERCPHLLSLEPSPDGAWVALSVSRERGPVKHPVRTTFVDVIPTHGDGARRLATLVPPEKRRSQFSHARLAWASDSSVLYLLTTPAGGPTRLLRWKPGEETSRELGAPLASMACLAVPPGATEALVYPMGRGQAPFLVDAEGRRREVLSADFPATHHFVGLDDRGRVITRNWSKDRPTVMVTELQSGTTEQAYP